MLEIIIAVLFAGITLVLLAMMGYSAYIIYTDVREYKREKKAKEQERLIYYYTTVGGKRYDAVKVSEDNKCKGCAAEHDTKLCISLPECIRIKLKCIYVEHKEDEE